MPACKSKTITIISNAEFLESDQSRSIIKGNDTLSGRKKCVRLQIGGLMSPEEISQVVQIELDTSCSYKPVGIMSVNGEILSFSSLCMFPDLLLPDGRFYAMFMNCNECDNIAYPISTLMKMCLNINEGIIELSDDSWETNFVQVIHQLAVNGWIDARKAACLATFGFNFDPLVLACCRVADSKEYEGFVYLSQSFIKIAFGLSINSSSIIGEKSFIYEVQTKMVLLAEILLFNNSISKEDCLAVFEEAINANVDMVVAFTDFSNGGSIDDMLHRWRTIIEEKKSSISLARKGYSLHSDRKIFFERKKIIEEVLNCQEFKKMSTLDQNIIANLVEKEHFLVITYLELFMYSKNKKQLRHNLLNLPNIVSASNGISNDQCSTSDDLVDDSVIAIIECTLRIMKMKGVIDNELQNKIMNLAQEQDASILSAIVGYKQNEDMDNLIEAIIKIIRSGNDGMVESSSFESAE